MNCFPKLRTKKEKYARFALELLSAGFFALFICLLFNKPITEYQDKAVNLYTTISSYFNDHELKSVDSIIYQDSSECKIDNTLNSEDDIHNGFFNDKDEDF